MSKYLGSKLISTANVEEVPIDTLVTIIGVSDDVYTDENGKVWLRTGIVETDSTVYPEATPNNILTLGNSLNITIAGVPGILFNNDGTKLFVHNAINVISEYGLSTGYDLATATLTSTMTLTGIIDLGGNIISNPGGTVFNIFQSSDDMAYTLNMTTGFDLSTATLSPTVVDLSAFIFPDSLNWSLDGTFLIANSLGNIVDRIVSSTPYDINSLTGFSTFSTRIRDENGEGNNFGSTVGGNIAFNEDYTRFYIFSSGRNLYEYEINDFGANGLLGNILSITDLIAELGIGFSHRLIRADNSTVWLWDPNGDEIIAVPIISATGHNVSIDSGNNIQYIKVT